MTHLPPYTPDPRFDPDWRDDTIVPYVVHFPLILPEETPRAKIWVKKQWKRSEEGFGQDYRLDPPRQVTMILKPSEMIAFYTATDSEGNVIAKDDPIMDVMFPPKCWMSDSMAERSMMFLTAEEANGRVLVGGLGLAIYPQFVLTFRKHVKEITIVEIDPDVIRITGDYWLARMKPEERAKLTIVEDSIEHYLQTTDQTFDTIYIDTWDDADSRFLPHVNDLVQMALAKCLAKGRVWAWEYGIMVKQFVRDALMFVEKEFPLHDFNLDPGLQRYADWLKEQADAGITPSKEQIEEVARQIALTTIASLNTYDRHRCFTAYARSHADYHVMMARTRKPRPEGEDEGEREEANQKA